jgi:hypothetical protein
MDVAVGSLTCFRFMALVVVARSAEAIECVRALVSERGGADDAAPSPTDREARELDARFRGIYRAAWTHMPDGDVVGDRIQHGRRSPLAESSAEKSVRPALYTMCIGKDAVGGTLGPSMRISSCPFLI